MRTHALHGPELLEDRLVPSFVGLMSHQIELARQRVLWELNSALNDPTPSSPWSVPDQTHRQHADRTDWSSGEAMGPSGIGEGWSIVRRAADGTLRTLLRDAPPRLPARGLTMMGVYVDEDGPIAAKNMSAAGRVRSNGTGLAAGEVALWPGSPETSLLRWESPRQGRLSVTALLRDITRDWGDGVTYRLVHRHGESSTLLASNLLINRSASSRAVDGGRFTIDVEKGDVLEVEVSAKGTKGDQLDNGYDWTAVNLRLHLGPPSLRYLPDAVTLLEDSLPLRRTQAGAQRAVPHGDLVDLERTQPFSLVARARILADPAAYARNSTLTLIEKGDFAGNKPSVGMALRPGTQTINVWLQGENFSNRLYWQGDLAGTDLRQEHTYLVSYDGSGDAKGIRVFVDDKEIIPRYREATLSTSIRSAEPVTLGEGMSADRVGTFIPGEIREAALARRTLTPETLFDEPPVPEPVEMVRIVPSFTLAWHGDGVLLTYKHIPREVQLVFSAYETHQVLTFAQGSGSRVIPLPWANGTRAAQVRPVWAETGRVVRLGVAGPSFQYAGYDCPRDLALGMSVDEAAYDIVQGTDPDAWVQAMTYTHVTLGREVAEHFAAVAVERAGLLFPSNRDMLALRRPDLFGRTAAEDEAHLLNLATQRSEQNGTQRGYEENLLRREIKNLTDFLEQAKNMGWPMLMKEVENAFGMVLFQKIGLPWTGGPMLPRQNGDGIVFEYLNRKLPDGTVLYVHDERYVRAAVEGVFEELYALHVHFRGEDAEIQERDANLRQIAANVAAAVAAAEQQQQTPAYASREDLLAAIERAAAAGRVSLANSLRMALGMATRVATAGSSDGGVEIGGIEWRNAEKTEVLAWVEHGNAAIQEWDVLRAAVGWYTNRSDGGLVTIGNLSVRTMTAVGRLYMGIYQNLIAEPEETLQYRLSLIQEVTGISAFQLQGLRRYAQHHPHQDFARRLGDLFTSHGYGHIFAPESSQLPAAPFSRLTMDRQTYVNGMMRVTWDMHQFDKAVDHMRLYLTDSAGNQLSPLLSLTGDIRGQMYANIPVENLGISGTGFRMKMCIWFADGTTGHILSAPEPTFSIAWDGTRSAENVDVNAFTKLDGAALTEAERRLVEEALDIDFSSTPEGFANRKILEKLIKDYIHKGELKFDGSVNGFELESSIKHGGEQCKEWVQVDILEPIIHARVANNDLKHPGHWLPDTTGKVSEIDKSDSGGLAEAILAAAPGDVVHMYHSKIENNHTMIISKITTNGVWVFDSNWGNNKVYQLNEDGTIAINAHGHKILLQDDETVRYRFVKFSDLDANVRSFSIYRVAL